VTIKTFVEALAAVDVAGVKRRYKYPPMQINTADLPASFPRPPQSNYDPMSICDDTADLIVAQLVIATEATGQNMQPTNYAAMLTMADNLNAALKSNQTTLGAMVTWVIRAQDTSPINVGGVPYWGVSATVTKRG
jgi:hypothetical protein